MSAQNPKNQQEAHAIEEKGVKHQLSQAIDAQERNVQNLKQDKAKKSEFDQEADKLNSLKKENELLQENNH